MQADFSDSKGTIVVFDDDGDLLEIFQFLLEGEGYDVVCFTDGSDMVEKVRKAAPILILMDNWMPTISGEEGIGLLREQVDLKRIYIILISASNDAKEAALRAGADGFIAKPFEFEEIIKMIDELTGRGR